MVPAQETSVRSLTIDVFGTIDHVSIYDGDATVGGYGSWGITGSLALRSHLPFGAEIFAPFTPKDSDPYSLTPRILMPGGWVTLSLSKDPREGPDLFLAAGVAYLDIADWPDFSDCEPPTCFHEGGPSIRNGGSWTFLWGGGFTYKFPGRLSLRVDARIPSKTDAVREKPVRIGFGVGFRVR